jgi:hypothetical protein
MDYCSKQREKPLKGGGGEAEGKMSPEELAGTTVTCDDWAASCVLVRRLDIGRLRSQKRKSHGPKGKGLPFRLRRPGANGENWAKPHGSLGQREYVVESAVFRANEKLCMMNKSRGPYQCDNKNQFVTDLQKLESE